MQLADEGRVLTRDGQLRHAPGLGDLAGAGFQSAGKFNSTPAPFTPLWWLAANAENMLALRVNRANGEWRGYRATEYRYAA